VIYLVIKQRGNFSNLFNFEKFAASFFIPAARPKTSPRAILDYYTNPPDRHMATQVEHRQFGHNPAFGGNKKRSREQFQNPGN